ncbi:LacI family DNA-binding transcriptional regulator [Jiangella rhizosphaerae]|uniref:LacI family transcriptional regulator n=1 Tax=Jiangella rhizosphaerae TaxID=2293569 RepID=A0A418KTZ9_9ACTN|nr:LacI family DNA-binding transcriptional regulator [Jiangella rhizosphaerae]RIQ31011.1 LacI family transcriptional regulator [Jiangella rhizosphaerae]
MTAETDDDTRPATISRVAELAGVSRATVSRVMNGSSTVAPHLAERVRRAAAALNYQPSVLARSLAVGRTTTIALVVPDLANPMFQDVLRSLSHAAATQGHRLLVADSEENVAEEGLIALEARRRCDGLVLCAPRMPDDELAALAPKLAPFVLVNRDAVGLSVPSVTVDYAAGIRDLVSHLQGLGHRRLAYLAGPPTSASNLQRLSTLRGFAAAGRVELVEHECGATFSDGHAVAGRLLDDGCTAVIAYNDLVAFGALSGLHELGVSVPGQISVAGFDDIPFAQYTTPPLTTAAVPPTELGERAWQRLWALLNGEPPPADARFRPRLVVRGSTGPAASANGA